MVFVALSGISSPSGLGVVLNHLDPALPAGKAAAPRSAMLHLLAWRGPSSWAGIAALGGRRHVVVAIGVGWLDKRLRILDKGPRESGAEGVVWQCWGIGAMGDNGGRGMVGVGGGVGIGVDAVVLGWDGVAWGIVSRHGVTFGRGECSRGVVAVGDGMLAATGSNVIQGRGLQGFEGDRACWTMAAQGSQARRRATGEERACWDMWAGLEVERRRPAVVRVMAASFKCATECSTGPVARRSSCC